ncbi:MAG TPA: translation initiation factor 2 [Myxococcales bacterium]|nr:translation initiation factor 2 [Myxococcales bacterium]
MKTLTEFSGTMIRMAAKAEAEARKSLPPEVVRVAPPPAVTEGVTAKPNENASAVLVDSGGDSPTGAAALALAEQAAGGASAVIGTTSEPHIEKPGEAGTTEDLMQPGAAAEEAREESAADQDLSGAGPDLKNTPGGAKPSEVNADQEGQPRAVLETETSAVKETLDKAVGEATGTTGERLDRLREAVKAAGRQADRVRLVRVFGAEEEVQGAKKIGGHQYVVDLMPQSMKQSFERDDRAGKRGPRRPSGGGKKGAEGSLEGSFSMESVMQDRRTERGPGGGRGGPGGGRPGGRGGPGGGRGGPGGGRGGPGGARGGRPGTGGRGPGGGGGPKGAGPAKP